MNASATSLGKTQSPKGEPFGLIKWYICELVIDRKTRFITPKCIFAKTK